LHFLKNRARVLDYLPVTNDLSRKKVYGTHLMAVLETSKIPFQDLQTDRPSRILERRPSYSSEWEWIDEATAFSAIDVTWSSKDRFDNLLGPFDLNSFDLNSCSFKNIQDEIYETFVAWCSREYYNVDFQNTFQAKSYKSYKNRDVIFIISFKNFYEHNYMNIIIRKNCPILKSI